MQVRWGYFFEKTPKRRVKKKSKIYWEEELENFVNSINFLYLEVGGYEDILAMCYWDFLSILDSIKIRNKRMKGEPLTKSELPKSNKDMIERVKNL
jgi:hypothetical protein